MRCPRSPSASASRSDASRRAPPRSAARRALCVPPTPAPAPARAHAHQPAAAQEVLERQNKERKAVFEKRRQMYLDSRLCPIQKPSNGASMMMRVKQDRGPAVSERTRGNAHPQLTHSKSVTSSSVLGIAYAPTAGSMDAVKGADLQEVHPWKLLALCCSNDPAVNVAAIYAMKEIGRDRMCSALQGGYAELIDRILGEIEDPNHHIRSAMAQALGVLAVEGDQVVVEELMVAADDENDYVRASALSSLAIIAPREAGGDRCTSLPVQTVLARIQDDDPDVREAAVFALGALAPIGALSYPCNPRMWPASARIHASHTAI